MAKKRSTATRRRDASAAAERAAAIRKAQEAKERRRRAVVVGVLGAVLLVLVLGIGLAVQSSRDTSGESATAPSGATGYGVQVGTGGSTMTVYEDFLCPFCGQFEAASRGWVQQAIDDGTLTVDYHVVSILDSGSSTGYSTRAANAFAAVLDANGPQIAKSFHDLLYANQPEEGSAGLSDAQLVRYAVQAGASRSPVSAAVSDGTYEGWVANGTDAFSKQGFTSTPTVLLDGKKVPFTSTEGLSATLRQQVLGSS